MAVILPKQSMYALITVRPRDDKKKKDLPETDHFCGTGNKKCVIRAFFLIVLPADGCYNMKGIYYGQRDIS